MSTKTTPKTNKTKLTLEELYLRTWKERLHIRINSKRHPLIFPAKFIFPDETSQGVILYYRDKHYLTFETRIKPDYDISLPLDIKCIINSYGISRSIEHMVIPIMYSSNFIIFTSGEFSGDGILDLYNRYDSVFHYYGYQDFVYEQQSINHKEQQSINRKKYIYHKDIKYDLTDESEYVIFGNSPVNVDSVNDRDIINHVEIKVAEYNKNINGDNENCNKMHLGNIDGIPKIDMVKLTIETVKEWSKRYRQFVRHILICVESSYISVALIDNIILPFIFLVDNDIAKYLS